MTVLWNRAHLAAAFLVVLAFGLFSPVAQGQEVRKLDDKGDWSKEKTYPPESPEGKLQVIRRAIADDEPGDAWDLADEWIEEYPNHAALPQAYLLRGDAKTASRDYYKALFDYEILVRAYYGSEYFHTALERELAVANLFAGGVKRKLWGMRILDATGEAEELYVRIQERAPGSDIGERASLALGDFYYDIANMNQAAVAYDIFLINYPKSKHRERVMRRLIQANLATFKGPRFDPTGLLDASQRIRDYQTEFPAAAEQMGAGALLVRIEESLALKDFHNAAWFERRGEPVSAIYTYKRIARDHPKTAAARAAINRLQELGSTVSGIDPNHAPNNAPKPKPTLTPKAQPNGTADGNGSGKEAGNGASNDEKKQPGTPEETNP